eukprot:gene26018-31420_t
MEGFSGGNDAGISVAYDASSGAMYVTGFARGSLHDEPFAGSNDIFLAKYASNGTRIWTRMAGSSGADSGRGVAVDTSAGYVYVTGQAGGSIHGQTYVAASDIILMKYAGDGTSVWTRMVGSSGNDNGYAVSVDTSTGHVYVTGSAQGYGVSVDDIAGAVYVTGEASGSLHGETSAGGLDIILMKYASNGTRVWTRMMGAGSNDIGYAVSVDTSTGAVYVTGQAGGILYGETSVGSSLDIFLLKCASNGTLIWFRMVGSSGTDVGLGAEEIVLMKYASNGTRIWTKIAGTNGMDIGYGVSVDATAGNVYVTGQAPSSVNGATYMGSGHSDIVLLKYASNGTRVWTKMMGTERDTDEGYGVSVDTSNGAAYVTGQVSGSLHGQPYMGAGDIFLVKYASNGTRLWTRTVGSSGADIGYGLSVDTTTGHVYVTGFVSGSVHGQPYLGLIDIILLKYASDGTRIWSRITGTPTNDMSYAVAVDSSTGSVYVTGYAGSATHGQSFAGGSIDIILIKYASNGTRVWTRMVGTNGSRSEIGYGSGGNGDNSSTIGNDTINQPAVNSSMAVGVLASLSSSGAEIFVVTEEVRVVSQIIPQASSGASTTVTLPMTEEEAVLLAAGQLTLPSISLFSSGTFNNSNTT